MPHPFTDVPDDAFYADAVEWAFGEGITTGTTPTTFEPDRPVTRGELVTMLHRALGDTATPDPDPVDPDPTPEPPYVDVTPLRPLPEGWEDWPTYNVGDGGRVRVNGDRARLVFDRVATKKVSVAFDAPGGKVLMLGGEINLPDLPARPSSSEYKDHHGIDLGDEWTEGGRWAPSFAHVEGVLIGGGVVDNIKGGTAANGFREWIIQRVHGAHCLGAEEPGKEPHADAFQPWRGLDRQTIIQSSFVDCTYQAAMLGADANTRDGLETIIRDLDTVMRQGNAEDDYEWDNGGRYGIGIWGKPVKSLDVHRWYHTPNEDYRNGAFIYQGDGDRTDDEGVYQLILGQKVRKGPRPGGLICPADSVGMNYSR